MKTISTIIICAAALLIPAGVNAQKSHPLTYIDKGACPFECCQYGAWKVGKDTVIYDKPQSGARRVGLLKKGSRVRLEIANGDSQLTEFVFQHEYTPNKVGRDTIYHDAKSSSHLMLPVVRR